MWAWAGISNGEKGGQEGLALAVLLGERALVVSGGTPGGFGTSWTRYPMGPSHIDTNRVSGGRGEGE